VSLGAGARPVHPIRDARLSDLKAEFEQLAMDARGAPQWIVNAHLPDQSPQARIELRSASEGAAIPIRELDATAYPPLQHNQLMSEGLVLCLKSALWPAPGSEDTELAPIIRESWRLAM
jgi:hypothetical protein